MRNRLSWLFASALIAGFAGQSLAQSATSAYPGAAANVRESQEYEQLLRTNSAFRARRMQIECGPVTDPQLHAQCLASFGSEGGPPNRRHR